MRIEHIGIFVNDLNGMRDFFIRFFGMEAGPLYVNTATNFSSYFLNTVEKGARVELMHRPDVVNRSSMGKQQLGLAHLAIALGTEQAVDRLTERIRDAGFRVVSEPRTTGDGYYESVIEDPEGNWIELTV